MNCKLLALLSDSVVPAFGRVMLPNWLSVAAPVASSVALPVTLKLVLGRLMFPLTGAGTNAAMASDPLVTAAPD